MALAVFTRSTLAANVIVRAADLEAGSPGLYLTPAGSETLDAPAYVKLQQLLDHYAMSFDWPFRDDAVSLQVSTRATTLPSDYWSATYTACEITDPSSGASWSIPLLDERSWTESIVPSDNGGVGIPSALHVYKNHGAAEGGTPEAVLYTNIVPDKTYWIDLHYEPQATPLAAITTKPWFPYAHALTKALAVELFTNQDDPRAVAVAQERDRLFREIRRKQAGPGERGAMVRYSAMCFRPTLRI